MAAQEDLGPAPLREPLFDENPRSLIGRRGGWQRWLSGLVLRINNAAHFSGSATFATAATVAVTFDHTEKDTSYRVAISKGANETVWITSKSKTGFTLNSSNATSTASIDWIVTRDNS